MIGVTLGLVGCKVRLIFDKVSVSIKAHIIAAVILNLAIIGRKLRTASRHVTNLPIIWRKETLT